MLNVDIEVVRERITLAVALEVQDGEAVGVFGPSGAGKSTLLDAVAGLVPLSAGRIDHGSRRLSSASPAGSFQLPLQDRRVGYLRQRPGLFPHMSVEANISYSRAARRDGSGGTEELIDRLELAGLRSASPATLSGGQARRVALARSLAGDPRILLADEPFSGLDADLRRVTGQVLVEAARRLGAPLLLVGHELPDVQAVCDRLVVLGGGRVLQVGDPHQLVREPASVAVARMVGYSSFLRVPGGVLGIHPQLASVGWPAGPGDTALQETPARVVGSDLEGRVTLEGIVRSSSPSGTAWECTVELGGTAVTCTADDRPPPEGSRVAMVLRSAPLFGADGQVVEGDGHLRAGIGTWT